MIYLIYSIDKANLNNGNNLFDRVNYPFWIFFGYLVSKKGKIDLNRPFVSGNRPVWLHH